MWIRKKKWNELNLRVKDLENSKVEDKVNKLFRYLKIAYLLEPDKHHVTTKVDWVYKVVEHHTDEENIRTYIKKNKARIKRR